MRMLQVLLLAMLATAMPTPAAPQISLADAANENVIRQMEREWEEALKTGDQTTIDRIVAPDCLFVSSTGDLSLKAQADAERRAYVKLIVSATTQINIRVFGDTAIVIGTNLETSSYRDQDTSGQYRWTDVFIRRNGQWQVVSAHSTRID